MAISRGLFFVTHFEERHFVETLLIIMANKGGFDEATARELLLKFSEQDLKGTKQGYSLVADLLNLFVKEILERAKASGNGTDVTKEDLQNVLVQVMLDFM